MIFNHQPTEREQRAFESIGATFINCEPGVSVQLRFDDIDKLLTFISDCKRHPRGGVFAFNSKRTDDHHVLTIRSK